MEVGDDKENFPMGRQFASWWLFPHPLAFPYKLP
jgi:hypothetical protein